MPCKPKGSLNRTEGRHHDVGRCLFYKTPYHFTRARAEVLPPMWEKQWGITTEYFWQGALWSAWYNEWQEFVWITVHYSIAALSQRICVANWIVLSSKCTHRYLLFLLKKFHADQKAHQERIQFIALQCWYMGNADGVTLRVWKQMLIWYTLAVKNRILACLRIPQCACPYYAQHFRQWDCGVNITSLYTWIAEKVEH